MKGKQLDLSNNKHVSLESLLANFESQRVGVLATSEFGNPYTSLITLKVLKDKRIIVFATLKNTRKFRNICSKPDVSILLDNRTQSVENLNKVKALTLLGIAKEISKTEEITEYKAMLLDIHPELIDFLHNPDITIISVSIQQAVYVDNLQNVYYWH